MKKQTAVALVLLLLIPMVWKLREFLLGRFNPQNAAGHPGYARNYDFFVTAGNWTGWGSIAVVFILWLLVCLLVIRSKERSVGWLFFAALGPFGFAVLTMLRDRAIGEKDRHERFVRGLKWFVRASYEVCTFVILWELAEQIMVFRSNLMILHQAAVTGMSIAQIMDLRDASSGMWAFSEGNEVMYLVILLYTTLPAAFRTAMEMLSL